MPEISYCNIGQYDLLRGRFCKLRKC